MEKGVVPTAIEEGEEYENFFRYTSGRWMYWSQILST
jgi:hypothetical protein